MNNVRTICLDWYNGSVRATGGSQLAYQYDHLSNLVIFENAPKLDNYYLIVEMKETEDGEVRTFEPIQLAGSFWLVPNSYTQLAQNISFQVCCKTENGDFERHSAQFTGTILPSKDHTGAELDVDPSIMFDPYKQWVQEQAMAAGAIVIDTTLSVQGAAAEAKAVGDAVNELNERLDQLDSGLTADVKAALLDVVAHIGAWSDGNGQAYYDALESALYPPANLVSISAVYTQSGTVLEGDSLDSLKSDLVVTAHYDNETSTPVTAYTMTGTLAKGTSTVTVAYGGKTTTFNVTVTSSAIFDEDVQLTGTQQTLLSEEITYDATAVYSFQYTFGTHTPVSTATSSNRKYGVVNSNNAVRDGALQYNGAASEWRYVWNGSGQAFTPADGDVFTLVHDFATQATTAYLNDTVLKTGNVGPSAYNTVAKILIDPDNAQMTVAPVHIKITKGDIH